MKTKALHTHRGLLAGGNWIVDHVKLIDVYPQPEQLANISSEAQGTGGASGRAVPALRRGPGGRGFVGQTDPRRLPPAQD